MPVTTVKIKERFKILHPGLNLSTERLDEIAARLAQKPADDASDSDVDKVITTANEYQPFSEIAKSDDRVRDAEAKLKAKEGPPQKSATEIETERIAKEELDKKKLEDAAKLKEAPEWFKTFVAANDKKLETMESTMTTMGSEQKTSVLNSAAQELFSKSEIFSKVTDENKPFWFAQLKVTEKTTSEDLQSQIKTLEEQHGKIVQSTKDGDDVVGAPPANTGTNNKMSKEAAQDLARDIV